MPSYGGDCSNVERIAPFFISRLGIIRVPAGMPTVALADDTGHTDPETAQFWQEPFPSVQGWREGIFEWCPLIRVPTTWR